MGTKDWFVGAALAATTLTPAAAPAATMVGEWVQVLATNWDTGKGYWDLGLVEVRGPTSTLPDLLTAGPLNVSVTASQIVLSWSGPDDTLTEPIRSLEFINLTHPYTSATAVSDTPGVTLSFLGGDVFVNLMKGMQTRGETFTVNVNTTAAAVPEAAPWATMLVGLAGLGTVVRARRRAATALA